MMQFLFSDSCAIQSSTCRQQEIVSSGKKVMLRTSRCLVSWLFWQKSFYLGESLKWHISLFTVVLTTCTSNREQDMVLRTNAGMQYTLVTVIRSRTTGKDSKPCWSNPILEPFASSSWTINTCRILVSNFKLHTSVSIYRCLLQYHSYHPSSAYCHFLLRRFYLPRCGIVCCWSFLPVLKQSSVSYFWNFWTDSSLLSYESKNVSSWVPLYPSNNIVLSAG